MFRIVPEIRFSAQRARLRALVGRFKSERRGNVAVITALAALPMISAMGCVIDYSNATMTRTKLQAAADAASLATVSNNSPVLITAKAMTSDGSVTGGSAYATNFFTANLPSAYSTVVPTVSVTKTGMTMTATVAFSTTVPTYFMKIVGYPNITIADTSTASYTLSAYIDFYLMLDVSGSMSFPSTAAEQTRLTAVNPDNLAGSNGYPAGCQFACHFAAQGACSQNGNPGQGPIPAVAHSYGGYIPNPNPGGYCQGFIISRLGTTPTSFASGTTNSTPSGSPGGNNINWTNTPVTSCPNPGTTSCIQLRADAVGYAVNALLQQAYSTEQTTGISNQFRVGLYPFIVNLYSYFPLTTNINGSPTNSSTINYAAAQLANLLDTGVNSNLGSGGTHFENAFPSMNSLITSVGTGGSSTNTLPYVFLVTDGSQDNQTQWNGNWSGSNQATTINPSLCTTLKNRGITIAVLYIPYQPIQNPNPNFAGNEDGAANSNIPNIPAALQSCASPSFYYTASTPTDIQNALVAMFNQAVSTAHISQ